MVGNLAKICEFTVFPEEEEYNSHEYVTGSYSAKGLTFPLYHSFDKYLLKIYYMPGTLLGKSSAWWILYML